MPQTQPNGQRMESQRRPLLWCIFTNEGLLINLIFWVQKSSARLPSKQLQPFRGEVRKSVCFDFADSWQAACDTAHHGWSDHLEVAKVFAFYTLSYTLVSWNFQRQSLYPPYINLLTWDVDFQISHDPHLLYWNRLAFIACRWARIPWCWYAIALTSFALKDPLSCTRFSYLQILILVFLTNTHLSLVQDSQIFVLTTQITNHSFCIFVYINVYKNVQICIYKYTKYIHLYVCI